ncbi:MAG TPA: hypothetical protein VFE12_18540, partial [Acetobacteraceae bacterium]|nr:hypothetical protein [Acetobacteraceae bacterium]
MTGSIWTPTIKGKRYAYVRGGGRTIRIRGADGLPLLPGDSGFEHAAALAQRALAAGVQEARIKARSKALLPRSIGDLIRLYRAEPHFRDLSLVTQKAYERRFKLLDPDWSAVDLDRVNILGIQRD